jgi:hypothetical protein
MMSFGRPRISQNSGVPELCHYQIAQVGNIRLAPLIRTRGRRSLFYGHNVFPNHIAAERAQKFDVEGVLADKAVL